MGFALIYRRRRRRRNARLGTSQLDLHSFISTQECLSTVYPTLNYCLLRSVTIRFNKGCLPFSPKLRKFHLGTKWNGPFRFGPTGIFEGGTLWPVRSFRLVAPKCPFPFDKIVVPVSLFCIPPSSIITKSAVAWVGCIQPECTVPIIMYKIQNLKTEFLLNGKRTRTATNLAN